MTESADTPSTDGAPDPEEVVAAALESRLGGPIGFTHHGNARYVAALAAAGLRVVPEDRPAQCPTCEGRVREVRHVEGDDCSKHKCSCWKCGDTWHDEPAGVPALDDDTRREVEALIEQHQWAIDREHPCSGACLGCGAGVDESCDPDCGCDEGEMSCDTAQVLEPLGPLIRFAAAYLGGTDGR